MVRPDLDERHRRILKFVVESHVMRAEPVGSQYVRMAYHLSISPATIRNAMKRLEAEGLLDHPHTSAGRVPTETGYRYYVDSLIEPEPIAPATKRALDKALDRRAPAAEDLQGLATRVLAKSSGQLAMVAVRPWVELPIVQSLDLVALEEGVILLALGERGERVSSTTWRPSGGGRRGDPPARGAMDRRAFAHSGPRRMRGGGPRRARGSARARGAADRRRAPPNVQVARDAETPRGPHRGRREHRLAAGVSVRRSPPRPRGAARRAGAFDARPGRLHGYRRRPGDDRPRAGGGADAGLLARRHRDRVEPAARIVGRAGAGPHAVC